MKKSLCFVSGVLVLCGVVIAADYPQWFMDRGIVDGSNDAHDYAPVNQGHVKWAASQAYSEFQQKLPTANLTALLQLVDSFPEGGNYKPANIGMLKAVTTPFYDELISAGYVSNYPWASGSPADYNVANQGQLKNLFSFGLDVDLDGDGLVDWWAAQNGLSGSGASGDADNDGISNGDEYAQGSNPNVADSGSYAAENTLVGNGETAPSSSATTTVASLNGSEVSGTLGTWVIDGTGVYAASRRGHIEYKATLIQGSIYQVEIGISQKNIVEPGRSESYRLRFEVDGEYVDRQTVSLVDDISQTVAVETPFLDAGEHVVQVYWDNYENDISLRIEDVSFNQLEGTDGNANGTLDWVENKIIQRNTIDVAPLVSLTSPACLEGKALYTKLMDLAGTGEINPGPNSTWYGNVDLNSDGLPHGYAVSFENNARTLSRTIQWKPTNVLTDVGGTPIRRGDALLLVAAPASGIGSNGLSTVFVNGTEVSSSTVPQPYTFASNGVYEVRGVFSGTDGNGVSTTLERTIQVSVVGMEQENIAAMVNKSRIWDQPSEWPDNAMLELDSRVVQSVDNNGVAMLKTTVPEERYGLVRLGVNGPVLAPVTVKGFNMWFMKKTYLYYDEVFEDGSFTATTTMIISPNVPEVWVDQRARQVITYEDGSRTREFHYQDYSNLGEVEILFIHPRATATSVCHYTDLYQDDVLIGRSY